VCLQAESAAAWSDPRTDLFLFRIPKWVVRPNNPNKVTSLTPLNVTVEQRILN
jgi:hypothetical protein